MAMSYGKSLARKAPPPDAMDALGDDEGDEPGEGTPEEESEDEAEEMSAWHDFAKAAGIKATPAAYSALKDLIRICARK